MTDSYHQVPEGVKRYWELLQKGYFGEGFSDTEEGWIYHPSTNRRVAVSWQDFCLLATQPRVNRVESGILIMLKRYQGNTRKKRSQKKHAK